MTRLEQYKAQIAGYAGESSEDRREFAERLAETLAMEVDELQQRLDTMVAMLRPGVRPDASDYTIEECQSGKFDLHYCVWSAKKHSLYALAVAIAEGRES